MGILEKFGLKGGMMENRLPDVSGRLKITQSKDQEVGDKSLWASMIGDPCERFLYHAIVIEIVTTDTHFRNLELETPEEKAKEYLRELGYQVQEH
jgi:hypothetical protein